MSKGKKLNIKQTKFIASYIKSGNATQAAIEAGYSEKTARQMAAENLSKPYIAEAIEKIRQDTLSKAVMTREELLKMHTIAIRKRFAAPSRFLNVTPDGDVSLNLDPEKMADDPSIKKLTVRVDSSGKGDGQNDARILSMEFHDYLDAAKEFADLEGFDKPIKQQVEVTSSSLEQVLEDIANAGGKWWRRRPSKNGLPKR